MGMRLGAAPMPALAAPAGAAGALSDFDGGAALAVESLAATGSGTAIPAQERHFSASGAPVLE